MIHKQAELATKEPQCNKYQHAVYSGLQQTYQECQNPLQGFTALLSVLFCTDSSQKVSEGQGEMPAAAALNAVKA